MTSGRPEKKLTILHTRSPGETRWALVDSLGLLDVVFERRTHLNAGCLARGRLEARVPGHNAAFVDLGIAPSGYLEGERLPPVGQAVLVQVKREAVRGKGPKVILLRDLPDPAKRLFDQMDRPGPLSMPLHLPEDWRLHAGRILTDDREGFTSLRDRLAPLPVELHPIGASPLFDSFGIEEEIESACLPVMSLPSGGRLIFEQTQALCAIDVDAGTRPGRAIAFEAIPVLARQIRLRGLGGQILIDFPRSRRGLDPQNVAMMKTALSNDPAAPRVLGATRGGLVEMVRPRSRASLADLLLDAPDEPRTSALTALLAALRTLCQAPMTPGGSATLKLSVAARALAEGPLKTDLEEARQRFGRPITLEMIEVASGPSQAHVTLSIV